MAEKEIQKESVKKTKKTAQPKKTVKQEPVAKPEKVTKPEYVVKPETAAQPIIILDGTRKVYLATKRCHKKDAFYVYVFFTHIVLGRHTDKADVDVMRFATEAEADNCCKQIKKIADGYKQQRWFKIIGPLLTEKVAELKKNTR